MQILLSELDKLSVPIGDDGARLLDALELTDKIREKVRERAKEILLQEPGAIPGWRAQESRPARELIQDPQAIFEALREGFPELSFDQFLRACRTSFSQLQGLILHLRPATNKEAVGQTLDRALSALTKMKGGPIVRLLRARPLRIPPPPKVWTPKNL